MSFGPIPARAAHGRENPVCAPLNRRPAPRARSLGAVGAAARRNPPVPRAPRGPRRSYALNSVVEPSPDGGAGELISGASLWASAQVGSGGGYYGQQHHRVSCLDREFKEKGGSLVVATGCIGSGGQGGGIAINPSASSENEHKRVNALAREQEAYGRRIPISNDLRPLKDEPLDFYGEGQEMQHARKNTLNRELVNENPSGKSKEEYYAQNHFRCGALRREQNQNYAPWASEERQAPSAVADNRRRNMMKAEYD